MPEIKGLCEASTGTMKRLMHGAEGPILCPARVRAEGGGFCRFEARHVRKLGKIVYEVVNPSCLVNASN